MNGKFIYTKDEITKTMLENFGYPLLTTKNDGSWVFINNKDDIPTNFSEKSYKFVLTNTLTF